MPCPWIRKTKIRSETLSFSWVSSTFVFPTDIGNQLINIIRHMIEITNTNVYNCHFVSDKGNKDIKVACRTFGSASKIAKEVVSKWEDSDAYELVSISLIGSLFMFD